MPYGRPIGEVEALSIFPQDAMRTFFGFADAAKAAGDPGPRIYAGTGLPNGVVTAPKGSLWLDATAGLQYMNTDGETTWAVLSGATP